MICKMNTAAINPSVPTMMTWNIFILEGCWAVKHVCRQHTVSLLWPLILHHLSLISSDVELSDLWARGQSIQIQRLIVSSLSWCSTWSCELFFQCIQFVEIIESLTKLWTKRAQLKIFSIFLFLYKVMKFLLFWTLLFLLSHSRCDSWEEIDLLGWICKVESLLV